MVLTTFKESMLPCSQESRRWRLSLRAPFNVVKCFDLKHRLASSAYRETEEEFNACGNSLMYSRNKSGPRHDPFGTPVSIASVLVSTPLTLKIVSYH